MLEFPTETLERSSKTLPFAPRETEERIIKSVSAWEFRVQHQESF
jgi:hypothetical protein